MPCCRVIALDFIGFGKSDKLLRESDITTELHATTVIALLQHLQLQDVTLVMHDWGGGCCAAAAAAAIDLTYATYSPLTTHQNSPQLPLPC